MYNSIMNGMNKAFTEVSKQTEDIILEQLNDFVSRGLIVLKMGPMTLTHDQMSNKINVSQSCTLVLKDKEYIEKLEKENIELKAQLNTISKTIMQQYEEDPKLDTCQVPNCAECALDSIRRTQDLNKKLEELEVSVKLKK